MPFGKYLLLERLSVGGMAEVFRAKSQGVQGFEKIIAIKRILPTLATESEYVQMFVDEAKLASSLRHPNICQVFELGRVEATHYMAMEYVWGKDLLAVSQRLHTVHQRMPTPLACSFLSKVCRALDYAHQKTDERGAPLHIVHRDCSPQNILLSFDGDVKLVDFGIAKSASRTTRTEAGVLRGKYRYMAPEQVSGQPVDHRADIFALGAVLFECLTGTALFEGATEFAILDNVRNVNLAPLGAAAASLDDRLVRVLRTCLAKDPNHRYARCSDLGAELDAILASMPEPTTDKKCSLWMRTLFASEVTAQLKAQRADAEAGLAGLYKGESAAAVALSPAMVFGAIEETPGATTLDPPPALLAALAAAEHEPARKSGTSPQIRPSPGRINRSPTLVPLRQTALMPALPHLLQNRWTWIAALVALALGATMAIRFASNGGDAKVPGMLVIGSPLSSHVLINGIDMGPVQGGRMSLPAPPGRHTVTIKIGSTVICDREVNVVSGQATETTCNAATSRE